MWKRRTSIICQLGFKKETDLELLYACIEPSLGSKEFFLQKAIGWARENAELSRLDDRPIRWICEDARKYVQREVRRGSKYDGIILDPPKYGRGPTGEIWRLFEDLPELLQLCVELLADDASFLILNGYAERISGLSLAGLVADAMAGRGGQIDWGELALMEDSGDRGVGLSFFARWSAAAGSAT